MRAPKNNAKGTSGQSFVKGHFEEIGWGAVPNLEHDLGTDLFIAARDAQRYDLGAVIGAQVKNWDIPFDAPVIHEGKEGWWFADSEAHFEYWLGHRLPHLQIYYDDSARISYWVHITREAVISTGKGRKIFVPKEQTIDKNHLDALIKVATSNPLGATWEGSAWVPGQEIPPESQLRYALIAPRLIAPHPNAPTDEISAEQGIALVTAVRLDDAYYRYREKQPLLDAALSLASNDPAWKLYGGLMRWIENNSLDELRSLSTGTLRAHLRAAQTASLSAALFENGSTHEAIELLEKSLADHDDYNPVDHAWLTLHLARNLVQVGQLKRARDLSVEVAPIGQIAPHDPTARLLSGVAAEMIFLLSGWQREDMISTIQAGDTAASWWRSQIMTSGLAKYLEGTFDAYMNDPSVTLVSSDTTWAKLRSASLISGYAADTSYWSHGVSLLAQYILTAQTQPNQTENALHLLRIAGSHKKLTLAVNNLLEHGPTEILDNVISKIDLGLSTRSSLQADLELIGLCGSILSAPLADQTADWLLGELKNPAARIKSLGITFPYIERLVETLSRMYIASSSKVKKKIREHVCRLPTVDYQPIAHEYVRLLRGINDQDWTDAQLKILAMRPRNDNFELNDELERLITGRDPKTRINLLERIKAGDTSALASWGDVRELPAEVAASIIKYSSDATRKKIEAARKGGYTFGGNSPLHRLILLNIWHAKDADWEPCIEALSEEKSGPHDILPGMHLMTTQAERIPIEVKQKLHAPLERLMNTEAAFQPQISFLGNQDMRGDAALLLAAFFPEEIADEQLVKLFRGSSEQIIAAVRITAERKDTKSLPVLAVLAQNSNKDIKTAVAAALGTWVSLGVGNPVSTDLLMHLLAEPGSSLAVQVARSVGRQEQSKGSEEVLELLEKHQSAVVRELVQLVRHQWKRTIADKP